MALPHGSIEGGVLLVEKSIPAALSVGDEFEYTIRVTNISTDLLLQDVVVRDGLSSGITVQGSTPAASMSGPVITWNLGMMGPGESETIVVNCSATAAGTVATCATASYTPLLCVETVIR